MVSEGVLGSIPSTHGFSRRFGCITPLHPTGRPRCPDMGGKKALETSTVNERGGIVAYGVQPGRIRRIYTDNSVYIIRCAVWRVSKIGRGLFSLVVKTPGCYTKNYAKPIILSAAHWPTARVYILPSEFLLPASILPACPIIIVIATQMFGP
jgi:hypothetical protein